MNRVNSLLKNTAILSLGTFFPKFLTVLITPILTAQLTKVEYGQYDLILTIVAFFLPIVTLQISAAAFRFLITVREDIQASGKIIGTIYCFVCVTSLIAGMIYWVCIGRNMGMTGALLTGYFIGDILLINSRQIVRGIGHNLLYSISIIIQSIVLLAAVSLLTGITGLPNRGLMGVIGALFLSVLIPCLFLCVKEHLFRYFSTHYFSVSVLKKMLAYSWPMIPNNLSIWALGYSDRIVITLALGIEANAIYAVANRLPAIFSSVQSTFIMAWQENASLAEHDTDKSHYYSSMVDGIYSLLVILMAGLIAATPVIWKLLIRGSYEAAYLQLPLLYLGMLCSCMSAILGGIYIAHMRTKSVAVTTLCAAGLNLLIDISLVHSIGIWAASLSTFISYFFLCLFRMIEVQKFQQMSFRVSKMVIGLLLLGGMGVLNYQQSLRCDILNIIFFFVLAVFFDHKLFLVLVDKFKKKVQSLRGI